MSWSNPVTRSTGTLITAAIWNADVVDNPLALRSGSIALASQAIGDLKYASSTTQWARIAAVATGQILKSAGTGTAPVWGDTLYLSSAGPHSVGGATDATVQFYIQGAFSGANGLRIESTLSPPANSNTQLFYNLGTIVEAASGTHALLIGSRFQAPTITAGVATVTNTATVYINDEPTATVTGDNHALWIAAGKVRIDGTIRSNLIPSASATYNLGADGTTWNRLFLASGTAADPSLSVGDEDTGLYFSVATLRMAVNGTNSLVSSMANAWPQLEVPGGTWGTGNVRGSGLIIGRNSSGSGAAGWIQYGHLDGVSSYSWVDATGDLRISTAPPDEDGTPSDTSGTVVGDQTSWHAAKEVIGPTRLTPAAALRAILDSHIYDFRIGGYLDAKDQPAIFTGFVGYDRSDWFLKNCGSQQLPALNDMNIAGYMTRAFHEVDRRLSALEGRT